MSVEISQERSLSIYITNGEIDIFATLMGKIAKKKMGFLKGDLTEEEQRLVEALNNYFNTEEGTEE